MQLTPSQRLYGSFFIGAATMLRIGPDGSAPRFSNNQPMPTHSTPYMHRSDVVLSGVYET